MKSGKKKGSSPASKRTRTVAKPKSSPSKVASQAKRSAPKSPAQAKRQTKTPPKKATQKAFPEKFPFWARLKISKKRTTLVIDKEDVVDKKTKKQEPGFVHREATHTARKDYEKIDPNPDKADPDPMYLKRPSKLPQRMFEPHNKNLDMPEHLKEKYKNNNNK